MPASVQDPALLSKSRLRSDLVAHNVKLPPAKSRKEVYVELYRRHVARKHAAEFSKTNDDDEEEEEEEEEERDDEADKGGSPEDAAMPDLSGMTDDDLKAALLQHGFKAGPVVCAEEEEQEPVERSDQAQDESRQLPEKPAKDTFKDLLPAETTPTGIYATRRRPIRGAAGRPVQYLYPDTPVSPTSLERREVERRLVPLHIQIVVFLIVTCLLYLIFVCVDENSISPLVALLDGPNQGSDSEGAHDTPSDHE
ncbi:hypothetical protein F2P81_011025 [Scophthalmus maximus]|uniref:LEM-like domain-containing protein n=1 Tax=Scophthalmus maximus TaxID=52904 RepID=A0A6A4SP04_SCOMX|nr:hypothetical protein F2P81_011025 [Scophthalmus maximus]